MYSCLFHLETIVLDNTRPHYLVEERYKRKVKIYHSGQVGEYNRFQILCLEDEYERFNNPFDYDLKTKVAQIFDDVRIHVNEQGEITLNNLKAIQERWVTKRKQLEKLNKGISVENYFNSITYLVAHEQKLICYLFGYTHYGLFFNGTNLGRLLPEKEYCRTMDGDYLIKLERIEEVWKQQLCSEKSKGEKVFTMKTDLPLLKSQGTFLYRNHNLVEGYIQIEYRQQEIKHSILWVG